MPNLETIGDQSYTQTFLEREFNNMINYAKKDKDKFEECSQFAQQENKTAGAANMEVNSTPKKTPLTVVSTTLTESSSSGSVTDSICTTYEQKAEQSLQSSEEKKDVLKESPKQQTNKYLADEKAKKEETSGLSSIFGGKMFQK